MNKIKKYLTTSEKQTFNLGKKLAKTLKGGEVLALTGELGAGKTVLIKGIATGLGIKKVVTSPTFVLMKVYPLKAKNYKLTADKLIHIDCYRTTNQQQITDIGATEYFGRADSIVVIEWAEKIKPILPKRRIDVKFEYAGKEKRRIFIR